MGLLSDIATAVENYPRGHLEVEIFEVDWPGAVIDVGEAVTFRLRVTNSGPLNVDDLDLLVEGIDGTEVKHNNALARWKDDFTTGVGLIPRVPAHSASSPGPVEATGDDFQFRASRASSDVKDLIRVSVAGWASDGFAHVFGGHTRADDEADDVFSSTVSAA